MNSLRRILGAYTIRNPAVGYCQSMNFIVGILMLFFEEEKVFWVLAAIVEDILPQVLYYFPDLLSSSVLFCMTLQPTALKISYGRLGE